MKKIYLYLSVLQLLIALFLSGMTINLTAQSTMPCGVTNPILELEWLNEWGCQNECIDEIFQVEYEGQWYFYNTENNMCDDFGESIFNCEGELLCLIGGFAGIIGDSCDLGMEVLQASDAISIWSEEACESSIDCIDPSLINHNAPCPSIYAPVCGCNGMTYDNDCIAINNGVTLWVSGTCGQVWDECFNPTLLSSLPCPEIYAPVCGCDGITYDNDCLAANTAGVDLWTVGACSENCIDPNDISDAPCDDIYNPVCACNAETYSNQCEADNAGIQVSITGECFINRDTICLGEQTQIGILFIPDHTYTWSNTDNMECTNCSNPLVTPENTTLYVLQIQSTLVPTTPPDLKFYEVVVLPLEDQACEIEGIEESFLDQQVQIFPNPATSHINIELQEGLLEKVVLFDLQGKPIWAQTYNLLKQTQLELEVEQGLYLLQIETTLGQIVQPIVISN